MVNYLPVGSQKATEFYAECALEARRRVRQLHAGVHRQRSRSGRSASRKPAFPIIGDDIKAQLGATIVHRVLTDLFHEARRRSSTAPISSTPAATPTSSTCSNRSRLASKKISKTEAVQSVAEHRLDDDNIHIGPRDYVPWQNDNKVCFLRMEGQLFGGVPMNLELRLSVEDSPNSAGRRDRPDPLREARAGPRPGRPDPSRRVGLLQASAASDDRREAHAELEQFVGLAKCAL